MKVYIGPYKNFLGIFQLCDLLKYIGVSEDTCYNIANKYCNSWLANLLEKIYTYRNRTTYVKIDNYDIWSADHTLAMIILPILKQLKDSKQGTPFIYNSDLPEHLHKNNLEYDYYSSEGGYNPDGWEYILDCMIYSFESILDDDYEGNNYYINDTFYPEKMKECNDRIQVGLNYFGRYFRTLWS